MDKDKRDDKPWDDSLRKLVRANPQAFVSWILGEAEFIGGLPEKLKSWKLEVDALVFSREHSPDLEWLHRRLRAMHDILRESPYYQEILQEGRQEGLEEGLQEGLQEGVQKGKLEGQRETLLASLQARFPIMVRLTKKLVAAIDDPASLQDVTVKISMAQTAEEVQQYLLEGIEKSGN